jgi:hypothetical protein
MGDRGPPAGDGVAAGARVSSSCRRRSPRWRRRARLTNSALAVRTGHQEPRVCNAPNYVTSDGRDAVDLAASAGVFLDPWQQLSLEVMLGRRPVGEVGGVRVRRAGRPPERQGRDPAGPCARRPVPVRRAADPALGPRVQDRGRGVPADQGRHRRCPAPVEAGQGDAVIARQRRCRTGHRPAAPVRGSLEVLRPWLHRRHDPAGRGAAAPPLRRRRVLPTLSARPNPQVCYFGTVPTPENDAEHWTSVRDRGRAGNDASSRGSSGRPVCSATISTTDRVGSRRTPPLATGSPRKPSPVNANALHRPVPR